MARKHETTGTPAIFLIVLSDSETLAIKLGPSF